MQAGRSPACNFFSGCKKTLVGASIARPCPFVCEKPSRKTRCCAKPAGGQWPPLHILPISYSPRAFAGTDHYLTARPAHAEEIACPRNLARNIYDCHGNAACFPHAKANVETRGESVFAARNAIDGVVYPWCHGHYPFQSWGINRDPNACWTLDFGRPIKAGMLALTTRADFPHDAWWTSARLTLSDGESMTLQLEKAPDGHRQCLDLHGVTITGLTLDNLKKADDPSPFPALTQVEVWGTNL